MEKPRRKVIIDCDPAADDALALIMAARSDNVEILGVTVVDGNAKLEYELNTALHILELCGCDAGVYPGARHALIHSKANTIGIFGEDGMGDQDLIHPKRKPETLSASEFIAQTVEKYPGEVEILMMAPVTNVAQAILDHPEIMKNVRQYWIMGTPGFAPGSATPVSEFNVYADPEAFDIVLRSGVIATIVGFDVCHAEGTPFTPYEIDKLEASSELGEFVVKSCKSFREFSKMKYGKDQIDFCDPVMMACALWEDEIVLEVERCHAKTVTSPGLMYGQVILYIEDYYYEQKPEITKINALVVKKIDIREYKRKIFELMTDKHADNNVGAHTGRDMEIDISINDGVATVKLAGRLDTNTSYDLEKELNCIIEGDVDVVFDLAELEYITSAGLRVLLASFKKLYTNGHTMKIINVNDAVMSVFEVTGMSSIFDFE